MAICCHVMLLYTLLLRCRADCDFILVWVEETCCLCASDSIPSTLWMWMLPIGYMVLMCPHIITSAGRQILNQYDTNANVSSHQWNRSLNLSRLTCIHNLLHGVTNNTSISIAEEHRCSLSDKTLNKGWVYVFSLGSSSRYGNFFFGGFCEHKHRLISGEAVE